MAALNLMSRFGRSGPLRDFAEEPLQHQQASASASSSSSCMLDSNKQFYQAFENVLRSHKKHDALAQYCNISEELIQKLMKSSSIAELSDASPGYTVNCFRADRDFWQLLNSLDRANLLKDINDSECDDNLTEMLQKLDPKFAATDVIELAMHSDDRIKKGSVLKKWLEECARDRVVDIPKPNCLPLTATLTTLRANRSTEQRKLVDRKALIQSLHPDAQVSDSFAVLKLAGVDQTDQENLLRFVWQLLRSGQLQEAQAIAMQHEVYWLSAALRGVAFPIHSLDNRENYAFPQDVDDLMWSDEANGPSGPTLQKSYSSTSTVVVRKGNLRFPIWLRTCWKYAEKLASNPQNWAFISDPVQQSGQSTRFGVAHPASSDCLSGILDMSIYGLLSNNTNVLKRSPLLVNWSDRLWMNIKAGFEYDIIRVIHRLHDVQHNHSALIPGCDEAILQAEKDLLSYSRSSSNASLEVGSGIRKGDCSLQLQAAGPVVGDDPNALAEELILKLQAALISGRSALEKHLAEVVVPTVKSNPSCANVGVVLKLYAHFILWMESAGSLEREDLDFDANHAQNSAAIATLVTNDVLHPVLECFIDYLIRNNQCHLVALYASQLCFSRRIAMYLYMLQSLVDPLLQANESHVALLQSIIHIAGEMFPEDLISIGRIFGNSLVTSYKSLTSVLPSCNIFGCSLGLDCSTRLDSWTHKLSGLQWLFASKDNRALFYCGLDTICQLCVKSILSEGVRAAVPRIAELYSLYGSVLFDATVDDEIASSVVYKQLLFWKSYVESIEKYDHWSSKLSEFYSRQDRISGSLEVMVNSMSPLAAQVDAVASAVAESLLATINCLSLNTKEYFGEGIGGLFAGWEAELISTILHTCDGLQHQLESIMKSLPNESIVFVCTGALQLSVNTVALAQKCFSSDHPCLVQLQQAQDNINALVAHSVAGTGSSLQVTSTDRFFEANSATYLELELQRISVDLEDLVRCRTVVRLITKDLLNRYLQICSNVSDMWKTLQHHNKVVAWCSTGIDVANLIASECAGLRLYSILNKNDLKDLLATINQLSRQLLDCRSSFQC